MRCTCLATLVAAAVAVAGCAAPTDRPVSVGRTVGEVRTPLTVTAPGATDDELAGSLAQYRRYVTAQVDGLVPTVEEFADAVKAKDVDRARSLFPRARTGWERIEPIAESFEDIDAKVDAREQDQRPPDVAWTGFHRLERDLWVDGLRADAPAVADQLVADVKDLQTEVPGVELTPPELAKGAKELLDEMAIVKLVGAEDSYSHTDVWDIDANIEGVRAVVAALRPVIDRKEPALGPRLDEQFGDIRAVLDGERLGDGFRSSKDVSQYDLTKLSLALNALSQSTGRVADAVNTR